MSKVYALLVGINNYHPQSQVSSLNGCVNDVEHFSEYLKNRFGTDLETKVLLNEKASREEFIRTFDSHLISNSKIKEGDTVLFYYSGHGSYCTTHAVFKKFDALEKDETLVLYDSRCPGNHDLADKEIALLIHAIKPNIDIVLIIDSCHSGSITRDANIADAFTLGKAKHQPSRNDGRELSEYLTIDELSYEKMQQGNLEIPVTRHIVLSACSRGEVAYENGGDPSGLFTTQLLKMLKNSGSLSYSKLINYLYSYLLRYAKKQTPQLSVSGGFDPRTEFIGKELMNEKNSYLVTEEDGKWTINCGAIHGLRNDKESLISYSVSINDQKGKILTVPISAVGLNRSELPVLSLGRGLYNASVEGIKPAFIVLLDCSSDIVERWKKIMDQADIGSRILFFESPTNSHYDYIIRSGQDEIKLLRDDGSLILGTLGVDDSALTYLTEVMEQLYHWNCMVALKNNSMSSRKYEQEFETDFSISLFTGEGQDQVQNITDEIDLNIDREKIPRLISLKTRSQQSWYVGVYYLGNDFKLLRKTKIPPNEALLKGDTTLDGIGTKSNIDLPSDLDYDIDRYKLIISKKPFFDYSIPNYDGLSPKMHSNYESIGKKKRAESEEEDIDQGWYAKMITIRIYRKASRVDDSQAYSNGKITLEKHPLFNANAAVFPAVHGGKNLHPSMYLQQLMQSCGYEIISIDENTKTDQSPNTVISLSEISGEESLKEKPLILKLHELHEPSDEEVLAVTLDEGIILPLGIATVNEKMESVIAINNLPAGQSSIEETKKKSLLRAVWFCLVKVVVKKNSSRLSWIDFSSNEPEYIQEDVKSKVNKASRIVLVIHGIIGNTKGQVACMKYLVPDTYDLMLAYDYENLNTGIEDIAKNLYDQLSDVGINHTQTIDIIAHSMGGLVSRFMIEHDPRAAGIVRKLFMFGTPNAGSDFGKLPEWRDQMIGVLTLACNVSKIFLSGISPFLSALNKGLIMSKKATNTLTQMHPKSDFYKRLNSPPVNQQTADYYVIAGDINKYKPLEDQSGFKRLIEKIELKIGRFMYEDVPNDIAVATKSIQGDGHIKVTDSKIVGCHHLNYFDAQESVNFFKSL